MPRKSWSRVVAAAAVVAIATAFVFWPLTGAPFINFDDNLYIYENARVRSGLSWENVKWSFTSARGLWQPLTMISLMADVQFFGYNAKGIHRTNVVIHAFNAFLLCLCLAYMTGRLAAGALVAALFALHPLHVESVAWAVERKDVLFTFFGLLALMAYVRHARKPGAAFYLLMVAAYLASLMSKAMLITLPFLLLLLDWWPLGRLRKRISGDAAAPPPQELPLGGLLVEKIPLLLLAAVCGAAALASQWRSGYLLPVAAHTPLDRLANALVSYVSYIVKTIRPVDLSIFYPLPAFTAWWKAAGAFLLLAAVSVAAILWSRRPFLLAGWLWYLGTLLPVSGLAQLGYQAMADRFTYWPLTGLFILLVWGATDMAAARPGLKAVLAAAAGLVITGLTVLTSRQIGYWSSNRRLFEHAVEVTEDNWVIYNNLGVVLWEEGDTEGAYKLYKEARRINPYDFQSHYNLGNYLFRKGRIEEAEAEFQEVLRLNPAVIQAHFWLGEISLARGREEEALDHFQDVLRANPSDPGAHNKLGMILDGRGRTAEALEHFRKAVAGGPGHAPARYNLAVALDREGAYGEAMTHYREALRINPSFSEAHNNLGIDLNREGRFEEALHHFTEAVRANPANAAAEANLKSAMGRR